MVVLTKEAAMRRFRDIQNISQETIETISLWVMHYRDKASIDVLVDAWLSVFKIDSADNQRIGLFFIMNDVVQKAKNKHVDTLIPAFQPAVLTAVSIGKSSEKVKAVMTRCINIFGERQVFTSASITAMKNMLQSDDNGDGEDIFVELDAEDVYRKVEAFEKLSIVDRTDGAQLVAETEQALHQLVSFRHAMEEQKRKMLQLIETAELAKRTFSHQLRDVTIVEDAYQKFGQGIRDVHEELREMEKTGVYPAATPPRDAPSPTALDDIYATGVENVLQTLRGPGSRDNLESADMDLGDDDDEAAGNSAPLPSIPSIVTLPPPPVPPSDPRTKPTVVSTFNAHVPTQSVETITAASGPGSTSGHANTWEIPGSMASGSLLPPPPFIPGMPPPPFMPGMPPPPLIQSSPNLQAFLKSIPSLQSRASDNGPRSSSVNGHFNKIFLHRMFEACEPTVQESSIIGSDVDDRIGMLTNMVDCHGLEGSSQGAYSSKPSQYPAEQGHEGARKRRLGWPRKVLSKDKHWLLLIYLWSYVISVCYNILSLNMFLKIAANRVFWHDYLKANNSVRIVAPMVDQSIISYSELAFRMFMRSYGADITVTPMIHAHLFVNDLTYRKNSLALCKADRPLIIQFCANKADTFLTACRLVEDVCDGVDLNLGCPQMVAKRGRYGAYLQDEVDLICSMVSAVRDYCSLPVSCKIRIRECHKQTVEYAKRLVDAGASMLTVHGRTREMKGADTGVADWSRIRQVVESIDVPVVANGNIQMPGDIERCLAATGAAAVMSAEGILYNPLLFSVCSKHYGKYLSIVYAFSLLEYSDLRMRVSTEHRLEDYESIIEELRIRTRQCADTKNAQELIKQAFDLFHRIKLGEVEMDPIEVSRTPHWISKPYFRLSETARETVVADGEKTYKEKRKEQLQKIADENGLSLKQARKRERRQLIGQKTTLCKRVKFPPCIRCSQPAGQGCAHSMCKKCCRYSCRHGRLDCKENFVGFIRKNSVKSILLFHTFHYRNPTCTGTSVIAIQYDKGVIVMTDRVVSYGKTARYKNVSRQYKVNDNIIVAFGGDHADFQWLQNVIERQVCLFLNLEMPFLLSLLQVLQWQSIGQTMGPKPLHAYLTSLLYSRRCKMNPLWNTLIVAGIEEEEKHSTEMSTPFIGVITQKVLTIYIYICAYKFHVIVFKYFSTFLLKPAYKRQLKGVAYQTKHVATGIAAMLLNQAVEDEWKKKETCTLQGSQLSRSEAEAVLRKSLELTIYHDCCADNDFELGIVDTDEGVTLGKQETIIGDWSIAETNCQYE
uniref:tRNA-dihydrouridine(16/17) synthase [NAD(P)(+)] n=1 Tax=Heterorhabditis bacteriophora TaxID=37862 RepID=A0A1I7XP16_HETBA